ncbi:MAG: SGNH/GDSL hydrolase family protein [Nocardioidaceae bacterium]|nr:SGNH/GDSL hydrolase family protein [Nocardioidaceae bacterium]MCL2611753.1 SGNH/GDSL hydrolase family protein [Nocardioidaceae bacterium]
MRRLALPAAALLLTCLSAVAPAHAAATTSSAAPAPSACTQPVTPRGPALTQLHRVLASSATHPVPMAALGSSTTFGKDLSSPRQRWTDRLMVDLIAHGVHGDPVTMGALDPRALSHRPGARMVNAGIPGAVAADDMVGYLPSLLLSSVTGSSPAVVFHMIGANDYWLQDPPPLFGTALGATTTAVGTLAPGAVQVIVATFQDPARSTGKHPWSEYVDQMRRVASADPQHRIFINLAPWFRHVQVPGQDPNGYLDTGGVHPSAKGQAMIASLLMRALRYGC